MGWMYIDYSCGHKGRVQMYGKMVDREKEAAYLSQGLCPECYKKKIESENEAAKKAAEEQGLLKLTGTPKQIAWAETLRQEFLDLDWMNDYLLYFLLNEIIAKFSNDEQKVIRAKDLKNNRDDLLKEIKSYISSNTNACWFIDQKRGNCHSRNPVLFVKDFIG